MDFAPYQDTDPSTTRALSPPPNNRALSPTPNSRPATAIPYNPYSTLPAPDHFSDDPRSFRGGGGGGGFGGGGLEGGRLDVNLFETSLPLRLDYEAMLAYLLLPPAGGVFLLLVEHKSDYVRFHAWQSSLLFSSIFFLHLLFSWSSILSWMLFAFDILLIAFLTMRAYRDADGLDRFEVPFFGGLASSFVDAE